MLEDTGDYWIYEVSCSKLAHKKNPEYCEDELIQGVCDFEKCPYLMTIIPESDCTIFIEDDA